MEHTKKYSKTIDEKNISIYCNEILKEQAEFILEIIDSEQRKKDILKEGYKIQIGCSIYFVKKSTDGYVLLVPDYNKNPFEDKTTDVSQVLLIQMQQNHILRKSNMQGEQIALNDTMIVLNDALGSNLVYVERKEKINSNDSGWYLGLIKDEKKDERTVEDYKSIYVYQLLKIKPHLLAYLSLPKGCLVVIEGENLVEAINENNKVIL